MGLRITEKLFGQFESKQVTEYTLSNEGGMQVSVINYGGTITKIITPDKYGTAGNVILGFNDMSGYLENGSHYIGSIVGRFCNRIAQGKFSLNGQDYRLGINDKENSLHGGHKGFDKAWWSIEKITEEGSLKLRYDSKDGEEGYPGNLAVQIIYTLTPDNSLKIDYSARTDRATPVNLTSHCYFNLSAGKDPTVLNHELELFSDEYTPVDEGFIPTGVIAPVKNTALDFNIAKSIGKDISRVPGGYDFNFILNSKGRKAASLYDPDSGRYMEMYTTEPVLQFYSGNFLHSARRHTKDPLMFDRHAALCLEAQHYPDSPNKPAFPDTILKSGDVYRQTTVYKFSTR